MMVATSWYPRYWGSADDDPPGRHRLRWLRVIDDEAFIVMTNKDGRLGTTIYGVHRTTR